jgi:hypothetical protein
MPVAFRLASFLLEMAQTLAVVEGPFRQMAVVVLVAFLPTMRRAVRRHQEHLAQPVSQVVWTVALI